MKIIEAGVSAPEGLADITEQVREYIREVRLKDGFVHIQIPERTCAVTITINDDFNIDKDFLNKINRFLPKYNGMQFTGWTTSNVKASLVGMSEQVMVESGELILGLHQSIYMVEFNGPSTDRRIYLSHMGTTLAEGEEPRLPQMLEDLYAADLAKEQAEKEEQDRIIAEMRAEYAERIRKQKEEAARAAAESEQKDGE
ncbi:secondary thiamine-phosphate synthase enzyme YjbQ [Eubacterium callanderi]|uniref:Secondary thiamine-phosphate synthase enzyme n=1 Tax=Eubacterium limosum TaxID=1736 RepID=A0A6N3FMR5_EUBLI|nr:secondary thiamine-phosphate synthase enzyme YjbQ [Eubacterium callanderi]MBO1701167.1 YjbQ family protein [Eubacterium callanderi]